MNLFSDTPPVASTHEAYLEINIQLGHAIGQQEEDDRCVEAADVFLHKVQR
jgi:hypothetical protein